MLAEDFAYVYATQKQGMWMVRQYKANVWNLNFDGVQFYLRLLLNSNNSDNRVWNPNNLG